MVEPYPLTFEPMLLPKVWGGGLLQRLGKHVAQGERIGESWEVADLSATSRSGAGGGEMRSVIARGGLTGKTLRDAVNLWGTDLLGEARPTADGGFPLLVKFLDAHENLSVQVHPSAAYAAEHADAHLKTESWYIIDAEPESVIYKGVAPGLSRDRLRRHLERGERIEYDLIAVPAIAGECHDLPSGTVHALGAGVLVAEVQTPSDTTFRLYDWGRAGRELHVEQALQCANLEPTGEAAALSDGAMQGRLTSNEFFSIDELRIGEKPVSAGESGRCTVLMVVAGSARVEPAKKLLRKAPAFEPVEAPIGTTVVIPAAIAAKTVIRGTPRATVLRVETPPGEEKKAQRR